MVPDEEIPPRGDRHLQHDEALETENQRSSSGSIPLRTRISPYVSPAIIVLVMLLAGRELVALRFAADAPAPTVPLLPTAALSIGLLAALVWALYRLTRRESRILVELFWSMLGMSVIVGVASVGITGTWSGVGSVLAWAGGIFLLWCLSLAQTEPGPDPAHLRAGPGAGF